MEIKNVKVYGLEESIIRSGYPMQIGEPEDLHPLEGIDDLIILSSGDTTRAKKLANTPLGSGHDNFLKGIIVQFDLKYPEYFSPQLQRYGFVDIISSQSKMHKITSRKLTKDDFTPQTYQMFIDRVNELIWRYNNNPWKGEDLVLYGIPIKSKQQCFNMIIQNLPAGYLKWMGISTNYLQLKTIYKQRRNHKLEEWQDFCDWIETLPYSLLITNKLNK